jgi:hypothetical protein
MADLVSLSIAADHALRDADTHGARIAAHFLRVQIHELFREARVRQVNCDRCEFRPHDLEPSP